METQKKNDAPNTQTPKKNNEAQPTRISSPSLRVSEESLEDEDPIVQMKSSDLEKLIVEASKNFLTEYLRKGKAPATPTAKGVPPENTREEASPHEAPPKKHREMEEEEVASKNIQGNAERELPRRPPEGINEISEQIEQVTKKLDELRRRGAVTSALQKRGSPFCQEILEEISQASEVILTPYLLIWNVIWLFT
ncbi:hypothetical protein DH2020_044524 [Rehmannia glutinosa]|uniref:Uncharacterized protein n=1 Tax=Rehmannia glutinosa TaxID=99300 RepID=A0ABR0UGP7_REHGL